LQMNKTPPGKPARGRPRHHDIDRHILEAARLLLAEGGYEAMTFDAVAAKSGVARPTIYRRWPSKAHLAAEVSYGRQETLPETNGGLRNQIHALVEQVYQNYRRPGVGPASVGLINLYQNDPALREELHSPAEMAARSQLRAIVNRMKARGEIHQSADADFLFDLIVGPLAYRLVFSSAEVPEGLVDRLTDCLCRALSPE